MRFKSNAFVPFLVLGDPTYERSLSYLKALADGKASALELGFAFSDPIADGPIIQAANHRALAAGITTKKSLELLAQLRKYSDIPISIMASGNIVLQYGIAKFYTELARLKIDALLCPDIPLEEIEEYLAAAKKYGVHQVAMVAPTTDDRRLALMKRFASGYVYLVSLKGTTGSRGRFDKDLAILIERAKKTLGLPVYVGFGISSAEDVKKVLSLGADGAICGSAIVKLVSDGKSPSEITRFVSEMID